MALDAHAHREKSRAALSSVLWSLFLTGIKIWAGLATNSLGILSEALHSLLDFVAAGITFYAVRVAAIPPDKSHPYGHDKVENLSALVETGLLVITCIWITWEAVSRVLFEPPEITLTWWAFAVVAVSLVVDINRSSMLRHVARKHKSQALEADALHFTTDIWSSAVVLAGLTCIWLAGFTDPSGLMYQFLLHADSIAALFVAAIILKVSWKLAKRAIHTLMDGGSDEMMDQVAIIMTEELPQYPVLGMRNRDVGARTFIELTVGMPSYLHVDDAHALMERIETLIKDSIPEADVMVLLKPVDFIKNHTDDELAAHLALRHDLRMHGFRMVETPKGRLLKVDIELPDDQTLDGALPTISLFEQELKNALRLYKLIIRIEPVCRVIPVDETTSAIQLKPEDIDRLVRQVIDEQSECIDLISIDTEDIGPTRSIVVHCAVNSDTSILQCHETATRIEHHLHHVMPQLLQIIAVLHPSPDGSRVL